MVWQTTSSADWDTHFSIFVITTASRGSCCGPRTQIAAASPWAQRRGSEGVGDGLCTSGCPQTPAGSGHDHDEQPVKGFHKWKAEPNRGPTAHQAVRQIAGAQKFVTPH